MFPNATGQRKKITPVTVDQLIAQVRPDLSDRQRVYTESYLRLMRPVKPLAFITKDDIENAVAAMLKQSDDFNEQLAETFKR